MLDIASSSWKIDPRDRMSLLMACCKDCIGNISVKPVSVPRNSVSNCFGHCSDAPGGEERDRQGDGLEDMSGVFHNSFVPILSISCSLAFSGFS